MAELEILGTNLVPQPELAGQDDLELWSWFNSGDNGAQTDGLHVAIMPGGYGDVILNASVELASDPAEYADETHVTIIADVRPDGLGNFASDRNRLGVAVRELATVDHMWSSYPSDGLVQFADYGSSADFAVITVTVEIDKTGDGNPLQLVLGPGSPNSDNIEGVTVRNIRAHYGQPDDYGLFNGSTPDEGVRQYYYAGEANLSRSHVGREAVTEVTAPAPIFTDDPGGGGTWTTETVEGVVYSPSTGTAQPGETVTVEATPLQGYDITGQSSWTHSYPDDPMNKIVAELAGKVAAHLGRRDNETVIEVATDHVPMVMAYIYGYTRGRGFSVAGLPNPAITHVIVSSTARLTANPEQVTQFRALDMSVSPSVFNGWTLPELAVLNQYRKRWA